jgi:hypothetical protein
MLFKLINRVTSPVRAVFDHAGCTAGEALPARGAVTRLHHSLSPWGPVVFCTLFSRDSRLLVFHLWSRLACTSTMSYYAASCRACSFHRLFLQPVHASCLDLRFNLSLPHARLTLCSMSPVFPLSRAARCAEHSAWTLRVFHPESSVLRE